MKFCYFLQTLRGVPLGYCFALYSYGPFDNDVLDELDYAETVGAVSSQIARLETGVYAYRIAPATGAKVLQKRAEVFLQGYLNDIDWVFEEFGKLDIRDLEVASTIVFADRVISRRRSHHGMCRLTEMVRNVMSGSTEDQIEQWTTRLAKRRLLLCLSDGPGGLCDEVGADAGVSIRPALAACRD
jgi:hypothetical protein